ncbi:hypothetical protein HY605_01380 [Candidatus Peregrinibacteria bacterium]|nr:hypothetical protein [Candidatus Peregrinibacteria bacterium]
MARIDNFADFDANQGLELDAQSAERIDAEQNELLKRAFDQGLRLLAQFERGDLRSGDPRSSRFEAIKAARERVRGDENFAEKGALIRELFGGIHNGHAHLTDAEKLFFEFLIGLLRFDLSAQMSVEVMARIFPEEDQRIDGFREGFRGDISGAIGSLHVADEAAFWTGSILNERFGNEPEVFWQKMDEIMAADPDLTEAAKLLTSLHEVPEDKSILTIAQVLHWQGFGGNGDFLRQFPELEFLARQAIAYNSGQTEQNFANRMQLFRRLVLILRGGACRDLAACIEKQFPDDLEIRVFDSGSGPIAGAVTGISSFLSEERFMKITAADVSGASLKSLLNLRNLRSGSQLGRVIESVRYQDLGLKFDVDEELVDKFHVYSIGNAMHQVVDTERGDEEIKNMMRLASTLVKPGGFVLLQDVGESAYMQFPVIPANLVDREGSMPADIYSRIGFGDVAVDSGRPGFVKVPYRLSDLHRFVPRFKNGKGIYESNIYVVIELPKQALADLELARSNGNFAQMEELAQRYMDIAQIQEVVRHRRERADS